MPRSFRALVASAVALGLCAVASLAPAQDRGKGKAKDELPKMTKTKSGLQFADVKVGAGRTPRTGQTCVMHYTGWLYENGKKGQKFDSSRDRRRPFEFAIGEGNVIKGWDEGVATMKPGGRRLLLIPPELGYGARGAGGVIPPNATLLFDVELLEIK